MKAISIQQPWAEFIISGLKQIENRSWKTGFRGQILIHASKRWDEDNFPFLTGSKYQFHNEQVMDLLSHEDYMKLSTDSRNYQRGGIVGICTISDCVSQSNDSWFYGPYGFVIEEARPVPFVECRGALGLFDVPDDVMIKFNRTIQNQIVQPDITPEQQEIWKFLGKHGISIEKYDGLRALAEEGNALVEGIHSCFYATPVYHQIEVHYGTYTYQIGSKSYKSNVYRHGLTPPAAARLREIAWSIQKFEREHNCFFNVEKLILTINCSPDREHGCRRCNPLWAEDLRVNSVEVRRERMGTNLL